VLGLKSNHTYDPIARIADTPSLIIGTTQCVATLKAEMEKNGSKDGLLTQTEFFTLLRMVAYVESGLGVSAAAIAVGRSAGAKDEPTLTLGRG
jgi:hypothetical protein